MLLNGACVPLQVPATAAAGSMPNTDGLSMNSTVAALTGAVIGLDTKLEDERKQHDKETHVSADFALF